MGRIIEVYAGPDVVVRSVKLKTKKGEFIRPSALLYLLGGGVLNDDNNVPHDWGELTILSFFVGENLLRHTHNNLQKLVYSNSAIKTMECFL